MLYLNSINHLNDVKWKSIYSQTVGSISKKVVETDKQFVSREHLCLTVSFDHDIVDGASAS
ncbi:MAG: 2-oxo acid dehydrogenase subunit E2 [Bacteroidales bacterium]